VENPQDQPRLTTLTGQSINLILSSKILENMPRENQITFIFGKKAEAGMKIFGWRGIEEIPFFYNSF
jgi:hypothetical protein